MHPCPHPWLTQASSHVKELISPVVQTRWQNSYLDVLVLSRPITSFLYAPQPPVRLHNLFFSLVAPRLFSSPRLFSLVSIKIFLMAVHSLQSLPPFGTPAARVPSLSSNDLFIAESSYWQVLNSRPCLFFRSWIRTWHNFTTSIRSWWSDVMSALCLFQI